MRLSRALAFLLGLAAVAGLLVASCGRHTAFGLKAEEEALSLMERARNLERACQDPSTRQEVN